MKINNLAIKLSQTDKLRAFKKAQREARLGHPKVELVGQVQANRKVERRPLKYKKNLFDISDK